MTDMDEKSFCQPSICLFFPSPIFNYPTRTVTASDQTNTQMIERNMKHIGKKLFIVFNYQNFNKYRKKLGRIYFLLIIIIIIIILLKKYKYIYIIKNEMMKQKKYKNRLSYHITFYSMK